MLFCHDKLLMYSEDGYLYANVQLSYLSKVIRSVRNKAFIEIPFQELKHSLTKIACFSVFRGNLFLCKMLILNSLNKLTAKEGDFMKLEGSCSWRHVRFELNSKNPYPYRSSYPRKGSFCLFDAYWFGVNSAILILAAFLEQSTTWWRSVVKNSAGRQWTSN